jgi:tetratricopeptide (TPR) repeat protein
MMEAAPGSDDARREAAINALRIRRPKETLALLSLLDPERGLMKAWTDEYWSNLAQAHHLIGDYKKELSVARRARRRDPDNVMFMALEARALAALHRTEEVSQILDRVAERALIAPDVTSFFVHVGGVPHVPAIQVAFRWVGTELRAHGHPEAAAAAFERVIAWLESRLEEEPIAAGKRIVLGDFLYLAEQWDRAGAVFQELHEQDPTNVTPLGYLGVLAARRGDLERAAAISTELSRQDFDPLFTRIPDQQRCWRARIAAVLGKREEAVTLLRPIFNRTTPDGHPLHAHAEMDFESLRDYPPFQALVGPEG